MATADVLLNFASPDEPFARSGGEERNQTLLERRRRVWIERHSSPEVQDQESFLMNRRSALVGHFDRTRSKRDRSTELSSWMDQDGVERIGHGPAIGIEELIALISEGKNSVLIGDAGTGKSWLAVALASRICERVIAGLRDRTNIVEESSPILLPLRVAAVDLLIGSSPWTSILVNSAARLLGPALDSELRPEFVGIYLTDYTVLIIVDGLDEVADIDERCRVIRLLRQRIAQDDRYRLLILTRALSNREKMEMDKIGVETFLVPGLSPSQLDEFEEKWFGPGRLNEHREFRRRLGSGRFARAEAVRPLFAVAAAMSSQDDEFQPTIPSEYHLMERLIRSLSRSRRDSARRAFDQILLDVEDSTSPTLAKEVKLVIDLRMTIVRYLSVKYVEDGKDDLLNVAMAWVDARVDYRLRAQLEEWPRTLQSILVSTGLLAISGRFIEFSHKSIAEHLSVQVRASEVSSWFSFEDSGWRALIDAAAKSPADRTLLYYRAQACRNLPYLFTWLQARSDVHGLLAARLIAAGVRAEDRHIRRTVGLFEKVVQGRALDSLSIGTRQMWWAVVHDIRHPLVMESVIALAQKCDHAFSERAVELLACAYPRDASETLLALATFRTSDRITRLSAATSLCRFGTVSRDALASATALAQDLEQSEIDVALCILYLDRSFPSLRNQAINLAASIMDRCAPLTRAFFVLANLLADLGPGGVAIIVPRLGAIAGDAQRGFMDRLRSARVLANAGVDVSGFVQDILDLASHTNLPYDDRIPAVATLRNVHEAFRTLVADKLKAVAIDGNERFVDRLRTLVDLARAGDVDDDWIIPTFELLAAVVPISDEDRFLLATNIAKLGVVGSFILAADLYLTFARNEANPGLRRVEAAGRSFLLNSSVVGQAKALIKDVAEDDAQRFGTRVAAEQWLAALSNRDERSNQMRQLRGRYDELSDRLSLDAKLQLLGEITLAGSPLDPWVIEKVKAIVEDPRFNRESSAHALRLISRLRHEGEASF